MKRVISLVTLLVLLGSPSLAAACAFCAPAGAPEEAACPAHEANASDASHHAVLPHEAEAEVTAEVRDCCTPALTPPSASAVLRPDSAKLLATMSPEETGIVSPASFPTSPGSIETAPPPSPPRAHVVLLI